MATQLFVNIPVKDLNAAKAFGVADRIGSLEPGKDADLVVWSGDPFEPLSRPQLILIKGEAQPLTSRQIELRDRYKDLNRPGRQKLVDQLAVEFPGKVREALGLSKDDVQAIIEAEKEWEAAEWAKPLPPIEADFPWHERGLGGHTF